MSLMNRYRLAFFIVSVTALVGACAPAATTTTTSAAPAPGRAATNPFFVESTLPYHAPRFDVIRNEDYQVALEEGMRQQLAQIDSIAKQTRRASARSIRSCRSSPPNSPTSFSPEPRSERSSSTIQRSWPG